MRRLTALDAAFLPLSTETAPLTIASVLVLAGPAPTADEVRAHLRRRTRERPELRARVVRAPADIVRPLWRDDPFDDPGDHLVVTDLAAGGRRLEDVVAATIAREVDLARPPWDAHLVTGLDGGRWALILSAHHVLADGAAGALLLSALVDGAIPPPAARAAPASSPRPLRTALRTVVRPELPPLPVAGPLSRHRAWRCLTMPTDELVALAHEQGCTAGDVFLAVLAGAYREHLAELGSDLVPLRVLVPVSTRTAGQVTGNLDAGLFVNLPVTTPDPRERLRSIARQTRAAKAAGVPHATEVLLHSLGRMPYPLLSRAARRYAAGRQRRVAGVAASVRGPEGHLELLGRRVLHVAPVMPLALEVRTSAALMTCGGAAVIGVTADAVAVPDLDRLMAAVDGAWSELRSLAPA